MLKSEFAESMFRDNVRELAHYLYVVRGCHEGRSFDYWLEAETQLQQCSADDPMTLEPPLRHA